tara:strand:+ start:41 stop:157 length:117 start_codon:yes stop_codon:yes gene_type:complete
MFRSVLLIEWHKPLEEEEEEVEAIENRVDGERLARDLV